MSLKFSYGALTPDKIIGAFGPNIVLTGDPAIDQPAMRTAGYAGGKIATLVPASFSGAPTDTAALIPYDGNLVAASRAFGAFVNGGGNYAESIGVSGSRKMSVARNKVLFDAINDVVDPPCYVANPSTPYAVGSPLYAGCLKNSTVGQWTADVPVDGSSTPTTSPEVCGICLHAPSVNAAFLGVATNF